MNVWLQLPRAVDQKPVAISLSFCGPRCLLHQHATFIAALDRPRGGFLFRTAQDTLIKQRTHIAAARGFLGFDLEQQRAAFAMLRRCRPVGVLIPLRECRCCYEMPFIEGGIACPAAGEEVSRLKQTGAVRVLASKGEALRFVHQAREVLWGLHQLGLWHGDPGYRNFIINAQGVHLIDLDNLVCVGRAAPGEYLTFLRFNLLPLLRPHCSTKELMAACVSDHYPLRRLLSAIIFKQLARAGRLIKELELHYLRP